MSTDESRRVLLPVSFSASNVLQLLGAIACFLAAFILPASFPDFAGSVRSALLALGCGFLVIAALSILLRPWLLVIAQRMGIRSRMLLPREGLVYLAIMLVIAIAALTGGNPDTGNMLLLIFGMMAGPFVFNGWVVVAMLSRVKVSRHLPVSVAAGTLFSVEIRLKNEKRLLSSRLVEVRDVIQGTKIRNEGKVVFVRVAPGEQRSAHYDVSISRRGRYQFGPLRLSSRFPLGIGERGHVIPASDEVIVHPKIGRLLPTWKRRERELSETISRANAKQGLFDDEFHSIREYRSGDNPRAIHWRSSARHGHFMVKEFQQHREADLIVLVDLCSSKEFSEPLQERTISLAATICVEQTYQTSSGRYRLMIAGKELQNLECSGSIRFRDEALKELAVCESSAKAQLAPMLLAICQSQLAPNSRIVLITPRPETARLLADSIAQENLRHEQQLIGRLMIVKADEPTLNAVLAFESALAVFPEESTNRGISPSETFQNRPLPGSARNGALSSGDAKLQSVFFRSMTLSAAIGGLVLCHSEGNYFPAALTPIVAVVAWVFVDQWKWIRLPHWIINVCGLAAVAVSMYGLRQGTIEDKLLSGAHMLVYLTCIVLLMQKGHRQYWWLMALILLQLAVAAVLKTGVFFGGSMLLMMALLLWTLSVFSLYRVMDQHLGCNIRRHERKQHPGKRSAPDLESAGLDGNDPLINVNDGLQRDSSETWLGWRFRSMVSGSFVVSLVLAVFVFAAFPRVWEQRATTFAADLARESGFASRSGFRNTVTLGRVGPLTPSQQRVLSYNVIHLKTQRIVSAEEFASALNMDEVRFRGIVLDRYFSGQWSVGVNELLFYGKLLNPNRVPGSGNLNPEFQVEITQDPPVREYAFAPYPVLNVKVEDNLNIDRRSTTGQMLWRGKASPDLPRTFIVQCPRVDPDVNPKNQTIPGSSPELPPVEPPRRMEGGSRRRARELALETSIADELPRLCDATNVLCTREGVLVPEAERISLIMKYLSVENGYAYSTIQTRHDISMDPLEDFVFNTKSGHCEYFASACVVMLQAVKVPARLVNGYYGSDLNTMTGRNEIRQRHAHSWVEVLVDSRWQTLDPTPGAPRRAMISAGRSDSLMGNLQTAISDLWEDGVHNMSAARQKKFFAPVISTSRSMFATIQQQGLLSAIWMGLQSFLTSPESFFSWRGGVATFLCLLVGGLVRRFHPLARMLRAARSILVRFSRKKRARRSVIRFYAGFCALCESHGMRLSEADSALENGRSAIQRFGERLHSEELRQLPIRIAMAFNDVRFGNAELTDEQAASIGKDLTLFSNTLSGR